MIDYQSLPKLLKAPESFDAQSLAEGAFVVHGDFMYYDEADLTLVAAWAALSGSQKAQAQTPQGTNIQLSRCHEMLRHEFAYAAVNNGQWSMLIGSLEGEENGDADTWEEHVSDWLLYDTSDRTLDTLSLNFKTYPKLTVAMHWDNEDSSFDRWTMSASELADWYYSLEVDEDEDGLDRFKKATFAINENLQIDMRYSTPIGTMKHESSFIVNEGIAKGLSLQQLPPAFLQEFNRALAQLRKGDGGLRRAS
jgi:hypothetical protein